jgi:hypothetical protein
MKPLLFSASLAALVAAVSFTAQARPLAPAPVDTIVVRLPNKVVMTLVVRDAQQLRQLPQYHLDSLVARLGGYIKQADAAAQKANTDRVTVAYFPNQDQPGQNLPEEIRITTRKKADEPRTNRVDVALDKAFGWHVTVNEEGKKTYHSSSSEGRQARRDSLRAAQQEHNESHHPAYVVVDFGLNALANKAGAGAPELRPEGSRYFNLGLNFRPRLGGKRSPLYLVGGPEFAFNNYMLEGNSKWVNQNGITSVVPEPTARQYQKTKLATSTFTVPLMLQLRLRDEHHRSTFLLGAGGFVGYRLASWTKLKYFENGSTYKDKDYGSYNLNDWQYGLQGTIGYRSLNLFVKYNLNELFRYGQGPQAQTLSFGLRLLGN